MNYLSQDYIILDVPKLLKNQKDKFLIGRMIWVILYQPAAIRALSISFKDWCLVSTNARYVQELQEGILLPNLFTMLKKQRLITKLETCAGRFKLIKQVCRTCLLKRKSIWEDNLSGTHYCVYDYSKIIICICS